MISGQNKSRLQALAGLINEDVSLISNLGGRSDKNTLSFYVEGYLLNLAELLINNIEDTLKQNNIQVAISKGDTKISTNSIATRLIINKRDYLITLLVSFEQNSNTSASLSYDGKNEVFNLTSRHEQNDINLFIKEVTQRVINSLNA